VVGGMETNVTRSRNGLRGDQWMISSKPTFGPEQLPKQAFMLHRKGDSGLPRR